MIKYKIIVRIETHSRKVTNTKKPTIKNIALLAAISVLLPQFCFRIGLATAILITSVL